MFVLLKSVGGFLSLLVEPSCLPGNYKVAWSQNLLVLCTQATDLSTSVNQFELISYHHDLFSLSLSVESLEKKKKHFFRC